MGQSKDVSEMVEEIAEGKGKYKPEAYFFILRALEYTLSKLKVRRHVTGQELLRGISEFGRSQYGPMTKLVFEHWRVTKTEHFGEIVFDLVEAGLMSKTEKDSIEDFKDVYDFEEEFGRKHSRAELLE